MFLFRQINWRQDRRVQLSYLNFMRGEGVNLLLVPQNPNGGQLLVMASLHDEKFLD
jgi:hypothetical protein